MTEIEKKALALLNEVLAELAMSPHTVFHRNVNWANMALCRAIEQHEAFRKEVSDAVEEALGCDFPNRTTVKACFGSFIITKPVDPLVEAWNYMLRESKPGEDRLDVFREALAKRGLQVTEIER